MKYRAHRYPTRFPVTVKMGPVGLRSLVSSISTTGACVQVDQPLGVGQPIVLQYVNQRLAGTVRWAEDDRIGVVFDRQLGRAELDRIRFGLQGGMTRQPARIGFAQR